MSRTEARDAAAESLKRLALDEALWDVDCSVLSGGERQRVNIAAGTVHPPRCCCSTNRSRRSTRQPGARLELIASLSASGVAVLAVFHDIDAMHRLATRVVRFADGDIAEIGPPADVLGAHAA